MRLAGEIDEGLFLAGPSMPDRYSPFNAGVQCLQDRELVGPGG